MKPWQAEALASLRSVLGTPQLWPLPQGSRICSLPELQSGPGIGSVYLWLVSGEENTDWQCRPSGACLRAAQPQPSGSRCPWWGGGWTGKVTASSTFWDTLEACLRHNVGNCPTEGTDSYVTISLVAQKQVRILSRKARYMKARAQLCQTTLNFPLIALPPTSCKAFSHRLLTHNWNCPERDTSEVPSTRHSTQWGFGLEISQCLYLGYHI